MSQEDQPPPPNPAPATPLVQPAGSTALSPSNPRPKKQTVRINLPTPPPADPAAAFPPRPPAKLRPWWQFWKQ